MTEFDSDETVDHFSSPWWSEFHTAVDKNDAKAHSMVDRKYAIITALWGLDCAHDCWSELHPVWAMAIRVKDSPERDDEEIWAMFVRNWGNEGFCGTGQHYCEFSNAGEDRYNYAFLLPWRPGATDVIVVKEDFRTPEDYPGEGPYITPIPGKGIRVSWYLPHHEKHSFVEGQLHLKWTGASQSYFYAPEAYDNVSKATGVKVSEEEIIYKQILQSIPIERREAFESKVKNLHKKVPHLLQLRKTPTSKGLKENVHSVPKIESLKVTTFVDPVTIERNGQLQVGARRAGANLQGVKGTPWRSSNRGSRGGRPKAESTPR